MGTTTMGVKLDEEIRERLKKLGEHKQRSTHWLMKEAILRYLEVEERYECEKAEDMARWERFLDSGNAIPHEDAKQRFDALAERAAQKTQRS